MLSMSSFETHVARILNFDIFEELNIWGCEVLEVFPTGLSNLVALEELKFSHFLALKHVPEGY
jgi:hypothetical protein